MNMPAGSYTIALRMDNADPSYPMIGGGHPRGYGRTATSYFMAEEIYPNI